MPPTEAETIGIRIRRLRKAKGLSLSSLSEATHLSKGYLSELETGIQLNPTLEALKRLAGALDVTIADLIATPKVRPAFELPDELPQGLDELVREYRKKGRPLDRQTVAWLSQARFRDGMKSRDDYEFLLRWLSLKE